MGNWVINLGFSLSSPKLRFLLLPLCFYQSTAVTKNNSLLIDRHLCNDVSEDFLAIYVLMPALFYNSFDGWHVKMLSVNLKGGECGVDHLTALTPR